MNTPLKNRFPIRIRHKNTGVYLYSVSQRSSMPRSSKQQIVAGTKLSDDSALWLLKPSHGGRWDEAAGTLFQSQSSLRIEHISTEKNLHSHDGYPSPVVNSQQEVTSFGKLGHGDSNDDWLLNIISISEDGMSAEVVLLHVNSQKFLHSHEHPLPENMVPASQEVTCFAGPESETNNVWVVEATDLQPVAAKTLFVLESKNYFQKTAFYKLDEATKWIEDERSRWNWVESISMTRQTQPIILHFRSQFANMQQAVNEATGRVDLDDFPGYVETIKNRIVSTYQNGAMLYSTDPRAVFLNQHRIDSPEAALFTAGTFLKMAFSVDTTAAAFGSYLAFSYNTGVASIAEVEKKALSTVKEEWQSEKAQLTETYSKNISVAKQEVATLESQRQKLAEDSTKLIKEKSDALQAALNAIDTRIPIYAAHEYWNTKAKRNFWASLILGLVALLVGVCAVRYMHNELKGILADIPKPTLTASAPNAGSTAPASKSESKSAITSDTQNVTKDEVPPLLAHKEYWRYLALALEMTFVIWGIRVVTKIMISLLHQYSDARERVVMVDTYLALIKNQHLAAKEDIHLVLAAVFRPGSTGLAADDTGAASPVEIIMKTVERK